MVKKIFIIALLEVIGAIVVVSLVMFLFVPIAFKNFSFNEQLSFSLVLGAMSAATAPAATIMVIRQFRAKGPVTETILPVTALDDIFGIIAFGFILPIARMLTPIDGGVSQFNITSAFATPLIEVFGSILIGLVLGIVLSFISKKLDPRDEIQVKTILFVLLGLGIAFWLNLSSLLICIMIGATLANFREHSNRSFAAVNDFVPVFYILFFAIAGATIDLKILTTVGVIGLLYIIARAVGKIIWAWLGGVASNAEPTVKKYLGIALLSQGGISIGLSILVKTYLPTNLADPIVTIILCSIVVYESLGPIFAKISLQKAGELYKAEVPNLEELDTTKV